MAGKAKQAAKVSVKAGEAAENGKATKVAAKAPKTTAKNAKAPAAKTPAATKPKTAKPAAKAAPKARKVATPKPPREIPVGAALAKPASKPVPADPKEAKAYDEAMAAIREVMGSLHEPIMVSPPVVAVDEAPSPIRILPALDVEPVIRLTDAQAEEIARASYERAVRGDTFDDLKRRAAFSRQDAGRLRHWISAARRGAAHA